MSPARRIIHGTMDAMPEEPTFRRPEALIDLSRPIGCHMVGVGGPGMSAIALMLARLGHRVSGSEVRESEVTRQLVAAGVVVHHDHSASHVDGADVVVFSTAIPMDHVELEAARARGIAVRHRSGMLASLSAVHRTIGVAGTHGKTTTSAILAHALRGAGAAPSAIIGAELNGRGIGAEVGDGDLFVLEADESDGTLDVLPLWGVIITNIDKDHLDYFGTMERLRGGFARVVAAVSGPVVLSGDDPGSREMLGSLRGDHRVSTFGRAPGVDARIAKSRVDDRGVRLDLEVMGDEVEVSVPLRGAHNELNVAAAMAMVARLGVDVRAAAASLAGFTGVARRFAERGDHHGAVLIDDYAHLPAEIEAAIATARSHPRRTGKVVAVFQPNRYHRVASMAADYADCFAAADETVITEIYPSGTPPIEGVSGTLVVDAIVRAHPSKAVAWAPTRADVVSTVASLLEPGDVCISMGCGDIESFPDDLRASEPEDGGAT